MQATYYILHMKCIKFILINFFDSGAYSDHINNSY